MGSFWKHLLVLVIIWVAMEIVFSKDSVVGKPGIDVFKEKWSIIFDVHDQDFDGIYTMEECYTYSQQVIGYLHASGDVVNGIMQFWRLYNDVLEESFGLYTTKRGMTRSEYVNAHVLYLSNHVEEFSRRVHVFFIAVFDAMDTDNDDTVSFKEFKNYYKYMGDSDAVKEKAINAFKLIDTDGDAGIREDEYVDAYYKYLLSPDVTADELPLY